MSPVRFGPAIVLLLASSLTALAPAIVAPTLPGLRLRVAFVALRLRVPGGET